MIQALGQRIRSRLVLAWPWPVVHLKQVGGGLMPVLKSEVKSLAQVLDGYAVEGELYRKEEGTRVRCSACGHQCLILEGHRGVCQVRFNQGGKLLVPRGYVGSLQSDPTEKKPFFHVLPGSNTLTFGMLGCDLHCAYCQNWLTSQALRDPEAQALPRETTSDELVRLAERLGAEVVGSSYNEPLITAEWSVEVFRKAKARGLYTAFVSNGNATEDVLGYIRPWTDCYKVDLKSMKDKSYRILGGKLQTVLDSIRRIKAMGFWIEVVTLVVPGFNDSDSELKDMAQFLASVSAEVPWHVTAFHRDYKMADRGNTQAKALIHAAEIGKGAGLQFVYTGNLPGEVGPYENTCCPSCNALLIERLGYQILRDELTPTAGTCPSCRAAIPGVWSSPRRAVKAYPLQRANH